MGSCCYSTLEKNGFLFEQFENCFKGYVVSYRYYISYQNDAFKRELEQCHIEIIDRLEENDNGFVLKEKKDLENTEVFND